MDLDNKSELWGDKLKKIVITHPYSNVRDRYISACIDKMKDGNGFLYILPSRESIAEVREKVLMEYGGIINSDIVTFYDFQQKVVKYSQDNKNPISDTEAKIIIMKAVEDIELSVFNKIKKTSGFINQIYSVIKKLKRNYILPIDKEKFIYDLEDGNLKEKLFDIFLIYKAYEDIKGEAYDIDDISMRAVKYGNSSFITSKDIIIIDGYINIDGVDFKFIDSILSSFKGDVVVLVPFANELIREFIEGEIVKPFSVRGFEVEIDTDFYSLDAIQEIGLNFGTNDMLKLDNSNRITFSNSPCIEDEIRICGRFIKEKLITENINPEEIAISANDEAYRSKVFDIFEEYGIPLNVPKIIGLGETGLFKESLAILRLYDLEREAIKHILSSPFFTKDTEAFNILEVFDFDIRNYYIRCEEEEIAFSRERVEYAFEIYLKLKDIISRKGEIESIEYLLLALESLNVEENVLQLSRENLKAYLSLIELLESVREIRDRWEMKLDCSKLQEVLIESAGGIVITLKKANPQGVKLLSTDGFKGNKYKIVCALGLNEGVIPGTQKSNGIFTIIERDKLSGKLPLIAPSFELKREKIRFNLMLTGAENNLFLSYLTSNDSGEYMIKSPYLSEVCRLMGIDDSNDKRTMRDRFNINREDISSLNEAKFYCNYTGDGDFDIKPFNIRKYNPIRDIKDIGNFKISPGKMESYGVCPFRFLTQDIMVFSQFNKEDFIEGNLCHYVLRDYYRQETSLEFNEKAYRDIFNESVKSLNIEVSNDIEELYIDSIGEIIENFIKADLDIIKSFKDANKTLEIKFIEKTASRFNLFGRIDRVDFILEEGEYTGEYIIHDYKFSSTYTDIKDIYNLNKIQLSAYRWMIDDEVAEITGKKAKCIGLLYRPLKKALKGERTLHGVVLKEYGKLFGFKGRAHFVADDNLEKLYAHLDEGIQDIRLLTKVGKINTVENCSLRDDYMFPCPVKDLCREGIM